LADSKLTAKIRSEIEALPDSTDLKPHVREYMGCLNQINNHVRTLLQTELPVWEATIRTAIDEFKNHFSLRDDASTVALAIFQCEGEAPVSVSERHDIFMDFIEYRRHLATVNRVIEKLATHFATGQQEDLIKTK